MRALFWVVLACVPLPLVSIRGQARQDDRDRRFFDYWHQGEAEISRYRLSQARYGENHDGHAVLIFVTEDFLPGRGVKYEGSDPSRAGSVPVLKLNFVKKFITGIYPYSMMCSVFTPTNARRTRSLKVSASIQEWCGHVYQQMNLRDGKYRVDLHSYFEQEADRAHELEAVMLEDEIWTRIRLGPEKLPVGELRMIPGAFTTRFRHRPASVEKVQAKLGTSGNESRYSLRYPVLGRSLTITFAKDFPHEILAWEEIDEVDGKKSVTSAERTHRMKIDYWTKNKKRHLRLRKELGL